MLIFYYGAHHMNIKYIFTCTFNNIFELELEKFHKNCTTFCICIKQNRNLILWRLVLLVEETGVPGENHRPVASHWKTLSHTCNVVSSTPPHERGFKLTTLVVIGTYVKIVVNQTTIRSRLWQPLPS